MELANGRIRVNSSFSVKVPGAAPYSSVDKNAGISLEWDAPDGADLEALVDAALRLEARLDTEVKLAVATHLGLELGEDGIPVIPVTAAPARAASTNRSGGSNYRGGNRGGGNGGNRTYNDPVFTVDYLGESVQVKDQRGLKASGKFKPSAADFKIVGGAQDGQGIWLINKQGYSDADAEAVAEQVDAA